MRDTTTLWGLDLKLIDPSLPPRQNGCHFVENIFKHIFINENFCILIQISLKLVPKGPIDNKTALVQEMAWNKADLVHHWIYLVLRVMSSSLVKQALDFDSTQSI